MGGACGQTKVPCYDVPSDRSDKHCDEKVWGDYFRVDNSFADCGCDAYAETECGDEVEESGPGHRQSRRKNSCRDNCCDRVGSIMKPVHEIESERYSDYENNKR